jgi:chromosome segregation ATPase
VIEVDLMLNYAEIYKKIHVKMEQKVLAYRNKMTKELEHIKDETLKEFSGIEYNKRIGVISLKLHELNERVDRTILLCSSGVKRMKVSNSNTRSEILKQDELIKERDRLMKENQELSKKVTELNNAVNELSIKIESDREEYNKKIDELIKLNKQLEQIYSEVKTEYKVNIKVLNNELALSNTKIAEFTMKCKELEVSNKDLEDKLANEIQKITKEREELMITIKDQVQLKESMRFKEQVEKIKKEKELTMEYHLKESNETLKKYSLENARLIVNMEKINTKVKKFNDEYSTLKKEIKTLLVSFVESFSSFNLIIQGKIFPSFKLQTDSYFNIISTAGDTEERFEYTKEFTEGELTASDFKDEY